MNNQNVEQIGQNVSGLMVKNLPAEIEDNEILNFVRAEIKDDLDTVNYNIHRPDGNGQRSGTKIEIFSGLNSETIHAAFDKLHKNSNLFKLPLYCRKIKNFTPPKVSDKISRSDVNEKKGGDPPNKGDGKESTRQKAQEQPTFATPDKIGGNLKQKSLKDFKSFTPVEKKEYYTGAEEEMDNIREELGLNSPKTLEFESNESEDDENIDAEKEKKRWL